MVPQLVLQRHTENLNQGTTGLIGDQANALPQRSRVVELCEAFLCRDRYESIHKALQYRNSEVMQIAIINESDGITMDFKENFHCSMTPKGRRCAKLGYQC
jgi:hypothetical protein